jgi:SpoVK/Ycf46/Vps4 family AAA+-type ATPase
VEKLRERPNGLSIFEGKPGTGKTFYLRHLMGELKKSHRFYFIPTSNMDVLSRPDFIGFWAEQRWAYSDKKFAVILEDSDAALMTRGTDNREQVSALLNLSDGMLADFLRLQIICTINCSATDIDPALLRPGRLVCHRVFGRLDYPQALRLAESLGRKLPLARDYSLAEVFAGHSTDEVNRPRVGFSA